MSAKVRSITKKANPNQNSWTYNPFEFPKDRDEALYVRQSSDVQKENNIHSYEMQTEKFVEHFRNIGCTGNIELIEDDEGMSGTLDIHKRPGMSRLMRLIEQEKIGWIGAVHVNRLFRDQWMINPDMFMKACFEHNVVVVTLRSIFNFRDSYSQRIFRIEAEEAARHLEWMRLIMGGALSNASDNGLYDGRYLNVGYIVDRSNLKQKKYVVYQPHAEIVTWLFHRFLELDGNFPELCREVDRMEYLFPAFEPWVDQMNMGGKFRLKADSEGRYRPTNTGIYGILTNPVYIGWWIPRNGGVVKNNHEPIVEEGLFVYAHKRVSRFTLEGERQKPTKVIRYGKADALLRKVAVATKGSVYVRPEENDAFYSCPITTSHTRVSYTVDFTISVRRVDEIFLDKFFERVSTLKIDESWKDRGEQKKKEQVKKMHLVEKGINEAELKMQRITALLTDIENPVPDSMKSQMLQTYKGLEEKKHEYEEDMRTHVEGDDSDEEIVYEARTIIPDIVNAWTHLSFEKRMKFLGALVHKVVFHRASPSWIEMRIEWKQEITEWDFIEVAHMKITYGGGRSWSAEEETTVGAMYPEKSLAELLEALPTRSWSAIQVKAAALGVPRMKGAVPLRPKDPNERGLTFQDYIYMKSVGIANDKILYWSCQ